MHIGEYIQRLLQSRVRQFGHRQQGTLGSRASMLEEGLRSKHEPEKRLLLIPGSTNCIVIDIYNTWTDMKVVELSYSTKRIVIMLPPWNCVIAVIKAWSALIYAQFALLHLSTGTPWGIWPTTTFIFRDPTQNNYRTRATNRITINHQLIRRNKNQLCRHRIDIISRHTSNTSGSAYKNRLGLEMCSPGEVQNTDRSSDRDGIKFSIWDEWTSFTLSNLKLRTAYMIHFYLEINCIFVSRKTISRQPAHPFFFGF